MDNEDILEVKKQKVIFSPATTKLSLSRKLLKILGITPENSEVQVTYTDNSVIIKNLNPKIQEKEISINNFVFSDLELKEKQLLFLLIKGIKSEDSEDKFYNINIKKIKSLLNLVRKSYEDIYNILKGLNKKNIFYLDTNGKLEKLFIFDNIKYLEDRKKIEISFVKEAIKIFKVMLEVLPSNYLENILNLKSKNSVELYLKSEANLSSGYYSLNIEFFKNILCLNYDSFDIKRFVVDTCVRDINSNTNIDIQFEDIKDGKRIVGFKFYVKRKKDERKI